MARYALTIFTSAFLLFQVQPLIGKFILPWFGGGPAVWTACMLFFQVFLLAGYAYAHLLASRVPPHAGRIVHWGLLAVSLAFLPIEPDADVWKRAIEDVPVARIAGLLSATIGLPYFLLASTGPLLQESFRRETGLAPYRLYALSNFGSLLALITYPFVFEPQFRLHTQIIGWSCGYVLFAALSAWCVRGLVKGAYAVAGGEFEHGTPATPAAEAQQPPTWSQVLLWLALAACGSTLLLATTNQLCMEVTTVPFLWVLPLALYLTTFIICFDHERWYQREVFLVLLMGAIMGASYAIFEGTRLELWKQVGLFSFALWVCCMVCHGELVRAKPAPQYATLFYLMVAAGGALGGVLVAIVAPLVLPDYYEFQLAMFLTVLLAFLATYRGSAKTAATPMPVWIAGAGVTLAVGLAIIGVVTSGVSTADLSETNLETTRNFYGVLRVNRADNVTDEKGPLMELVHGRIRHGFQYVEPPYSRMPTTYYGYPSGIGLAIAHHPRRSAPATAAQSAAAGSETAAPDEPKLAPSAQDNAAAGTTPGDGKQPAAAPGGTLRVGVIGLGCGTLAAYGKPGDYFRFYDINPAVVRIADEYFTYRKDSAAKVDIVLGDARINLERELTEGRPQRFDVLAIDAFTSDSIPMHLVTRECAELYRAHLKPDGLLCLHISNRFLNLDGVGRGMAQVLGCECVRIHSDDDADRGLDSASWLILTNNRPFLDLPVVRDSIVPWTDQDPAPLVWTDDYGSLWQTLKN
ncbi:MAG: fused MFS/spermidine synthase [Pirellulales bacterium]